jgi:hypothetical protein
MVVNSDTAAFSREMTVQHDLHEHTVSVERNDAVHHLQSSPQMGGHVFERAQAHAVAASSSKGEHDRNMTVERNAVQIGTIQRRNITHRKSQGRVRDRVSLGQPSIPVDMLLARKAKPREIDIDYKMEAQTPPHSPPPEVGRRISQPSYTTTNMPSSDGANPPLPEELSRCWRDKIAIEGAMATAVNVGNEQSYLHWEAKHREVSEQIYHLICPASRSAGLGHFTRPRMPLTSPDKGRVVGDDDNDDRSSSTASNKDWRFQGSSFVIYLETTDTVVPWVVWETMPVSLLLQAGISLLAQSHRVVGPDCVSLMHDGVVMDPANGCLSDYSVLNEDVVIVQVTMPRGGFDSDRNTHRQGRQTSKPRPTFEPNDQAQNSIRNEDRGGDNDEGGMNNRSYDKLKQTFKCPKFTGIPKDWKTWNKGFQRYLSIWELDHVLDPDFFSEVPLGKAKIRDNKLV